MNDKQNLISHDRMKEQIIKELLAFSESLYTNEELPQPAVSFEKGLTKISYPLPFLSDKTIVDFMIIIKNHIENIRIHSFDTGYYALQAMNSSLFKTENMLDNFKIELLGLSTAKIEFSKKGDLTQEEINTITEIYKTAFSISMEDPHKRLRKLGASVVPPNKDLNWDYIAGYEDVKRKIKESIILPLQKSDIYDSIAKMTRINFESNRPRAILFEGPPGVGKTTIARVIAGEINTPLIYVPIESIMSKWYGQSSQNLSGIFDACEDMGGAIIFLDEIDSLVGSRDQNMFEATRRILSVLLRKLDGIDAATNTITIGATNRKNDLDHALISRFDQTISFPIPNARERSAIFSNYARHLTSDELVMIGDKSENLSGRNIKDICEFTERRWARKIIIQKLEPSPPPADYYKQTISMWTRSSN